MKQITEREYSLIKALAGSVRNQSEASRLTGRSQPTVGSVWNSNSYDEYVNRFKKKEPVTVAAEPPQGDIHQLLLNIATAQNEILNNQKDMAADIQFLTDHLPVENRSKLHIFGR